jgi:hypothetical protein
LDPGLYPIADPHFPAKNEEIGFVLRKSAGGLAAHFL